MDTSYKSAPQAPSGTAIPLHRLGIDEALIHRLVHAFYDRIRADEVLGPIFTARITDWDAHLEKMCAFWSSLALTSGRYHGRPMEAHAPLPVDAQHFDRWLGLFEETARAVCTPDGAAYFMDRAKRVAQSLELGIASANGVMLRRNERYRRA
jgi:hemoglobin